MLGKARLARSRFGHEEHFLPTAQMMLFLTDLQLGGAQTTRLGKKTPLKSDTSRLISTAYDTSTEFENFVEGNCVI